MPFEILHFNDSEKVIEKKKLQDDVKTTLEYLDDMLVGCLHCSELLRQVLSDMAWRENGLNIFEGRRYVYKGIKDKIAIDGSFASYEYLLTGLFRLQLGFDKNMVDVGILLLPSKRGDNSPYGTTAEIVATDMDLIGESITVPVAVVLFDLDEPDNTSETNTEKP